MSGLKNTTGIAAWDSELRLFNFVVLDHCTHCLVLSWGKRCSENILSWRSGKTAFHLHSSWWDKALMLGRVCEAQRAQLLPRWCILLGDLQEPASLTSLVISKHIIEHTRTICYTHHLPWLTARHLLAGLGQGEAEELPRLEERLKDSPEPWAILDLQL